MIMMIIALFVETVVFCIYVWMALENVNRTTLQRAKQRMNRSRRRDKSAPYDGALKPRPTVISFVQ